MDKKQKEWIDNASYEDLLRRWRFAPPEDTIFQRESGEYYQKIMGRLYSYRQCCTCCDQQENRMGEKIKCINVNIPKIRTKQG